jgi:hypothetical protein
MPQRASRCRPPPWRRLKRPVRAVPAPCAVRYTSARYALVRNLVESFGAAQDDDVPDGFQQRLSSQPHHHPISNLASSSLLLHQVFPGRDQVIRPPWQHDPATADPSWPLPPPYPVSEDHLAYPEDHTKAITHLFTRLREYLDSRPASSDSQQASPA